MPLVPAKAGTQTLGISWIPACAGMNGRRCVDSHGIALAGTKKEDTMTSKIFGSIVALVLACSSATAADIRRVVTALDGNDKAIALFDGRVTLEPGATPSAKLWVTEAAPAPLSFTDDSGAKPTARSEERRVGKECRPRGR